MSTVKFCPNIKCPHCHKRLLPSISGYGRTGINTRHHVCRHCCKEYTLIVGVQTETGIITTENGKVRYRNRKRELNQAIKNNQEWLAKAEQIRLRIRQMENSTPGISQIESDKPIPSAN